MPDPAQWCYLLVTQVGPLSILDGYAGPPFAIIAQHWQRSTFHSNPAMTYKVC